MIPMSHVKAAIEKQQLDKQLEATKQPNGTKTSNPRSSSRPAPRTKVVVRRLPPNLPEDIFWKSVETWVSEDTAAWRIFCPGKIKQRLNKENVPSRAYISFNTPDQLALFSREYDGHVFRDKQGNESRAVVEFAPYQKVANDKKKSDPRQGTIEDNEDYLSFLESLNSGIAADASPRSEVIDLASQPGVPSSVKAPLIEALLAEKSAGSHKATASQSAHKPPALIYSSAPRKSVDEDAGVYSRKLPEAGALNMTARDEDKSRDQGPATSVPPALPAGSSRGASTTQDVGPANSASSRGRRPRPLPQGTGQDVPPARQAPSQEGPPSKQRPLIAGQLRHFEAALNAAAPGNRPRGQRKREDEFETTAAKSAATSASAPLATDKAADGNLRGARPPREPRAAREQRESIDGKETRDSKESREPREPRPAREPREPRRPRDARQAREAGDNKEAADARPPNQPRAPRDERDPRGQLPGHGQPSGAMTDGRERRNPEQLSRPPRVDEDRGAARPGRGRGRGSDRPGREADASMNGGPRIEHPPVISRIDMQPNDASVIYSSTPSFPAALPPMRSDADGAFRDRNSRPNIPTGPDSEGPPRIRRARGKGGKGGGPGLGVEAARARGEPNPGEGSGFPQS